MPLPLLYFPCICTKIHWSMDFTCFCKRTRVGVLALPLPYQLLTIVCKLGQPRAHIILQLYSASLFLAATTMPLELASDPSLASRLISRPAFLEQRASLGAPCDKLVVGVAIIHPIFCTTAPLQVLIVQRAAHEQVLPNVYELPGGFVLDYLVCLFITLLDILAMSKIRTVRFCMPQHEKSWRRRDSSWMKLSEKYPHLNIPLKKFLGVLVLRHPSKQLYN